LSTQNGGSKPDVVLLLNATRENAEARYLARGRDRNDSLDKFTRRFAEYLVEGPPVERHYREAGLLIEVSRTTYFLYLSFGLTNFQVDSNGTVEENIALLKKTLGDSVLWSHAVVDQEIRS
ncbi:hypothetical protein diail_7657, partial [Diaporthe ilicicola]